MAVKLYLISVLVAALVICVTADLPTEGNDVLGSNVELESFDSGLGLQGNSEEIEDVRQKREAIPDPKKKKKNDKTGRKEKGKKKSSKKGSRKSKKATKKNKKGQEKSRRNKKKAQRKKQQKTNQGGKKGKKKSRKSKKGGKKSKKAARKVKKKGKKNSREKARKSKKGGKKSKKGAKKSRKNKKSTTKRKRKSKKTNKKGSKKEESRKIKKVLRKSKKGGKSKGKPIGRQTSTATVKLTCLRDAVTYTKFLKDNVINFLRRNTRLTAQTATTNKKAGKKGEFKEPAARLIQAGGGDKTNLSCSGSTTGNGAKRIKAVTDILDACELSIKNVCKPPSSINNTALDTCKTNAIAFNKTVSSCIVKATKGEDACSCFQDAEVVKEKKVLQSCKGTSEAKAAAKARTACLKEISKCKNASTQAATLQYACSYSTDHLLKTLKQLTANLNAFKALIDKVKALTGLSPTVGPQASNSTSGRQARSDEENEEEAIFDSQQARLRGKRQQQACSTITTTITTCTTTISNKPASIDVVTNCKAPTYTIDTCSDADKKAIVLQLNDAVGKNAIIIAFIVSVNAELKVITGTTPKPGDLSSTGKASGRSRSVLRKMIMEKMNLHN